MQKGAIGSPKIPFICIDFFDWIFGVTARYGLIGEIVGIVYRCRCQGRSQNKTTIHVYRHRPGKASGPEGSMFLKTIMRLVISFPAP